MMDVLISFAACKGCRPGADHSIMRDWVYYANYQANIESQNYAVL